MSTLQKHTIPSFKLHSGKVIPLTLSYQVFGKALH